MNEIIEVLKDLNVPTILAVVASSWFFTRDVKKEIHEIKNEIRDIHKEFKFINIRLSRVEGTVYGKDIYKKEDASDS